MAEAVAADMLEDIQTAVNFLCSILKNHKKIPMETVQRFGECLTTVLGQRYTNHWYPATPFKGQAYRCIRINRNSPVDESLLKACEEAGLEYSELQLPPEFTLWIDPGDVSCRLSESSDPFQVGDEYRSGKSSPDIITSDYHSASPSECGSEEETQLSTQQNIRERPQGALTPQHHRLWCRSTTQAPGLWIPSPVCIPCAPNMLTYVQPHQPAVLYFMNVAWRPPTTRRPNPNLTKRLTGRACRK